MAKRRKRTSYNRNVRGRMSRRKTYRKKSTAKRAARGRGIYKVKSGWRISRRKRKRRRKKRSNPGGWPC